MGGSKRSERPEAEPGEKGESQSRSMSIGEVPLMSIGEEPLAEMSKVGFCLETEVYRYLVAETCREVLIKI